ncbi:MAG: hypothetical protein U5N26_11320 [Candidatus Marinimicrobia bacterium]|nr:hypothetical protein [Candidatus Neomarinimicrobiota bacterium]
MNSDVLAVNAGFRELVLKAVEAADPGSRINLSFYSNDQVDTELLESIRETLEGEYEDMDIEVHYGGQKTALLLIGLE